MMLLEKRKQEEYYSLTFTKMAKKKERTIEIPEGIATTIEGTIVKIKGEKGELQKEFCYPGVSLKQESNKITIAAETACKKHRSVVGTYESHLKNMFKGVKSLPMISYIRYDTIKIRSEASRYDTI